MTVPRRYFPVQQRYHMPGPTYRLGDPGAGRLRIESDSERERYLRVKRDAHSYWDCEPSRARLLEPVTAWLSGVVQTDRPERAAPSNLEKLVADIQEDVVVMRRPAANTAAGSRAVYVSVAFPSGWCPACAAGRSFLSLHAPVPVTDRFDGPARKTAAEMLFSGENLVRFVWTVTPDDALDRRHCRRDPAKGPPHASRSFSWRGSHRAFLRVERQVVTPIDTTTTCFFIRVYRYPVDTLEPDERATLRTALLSMSGDVRSYKGLADDFDRILALL